MRRMDRLQEAQEPRSRAATELPGSREGNPGSNLKPDQGLRAESSQSTQEDIFSQRRDRTSLLHILRRILSHALVDQVEYEHDFSKFFKERSGDGHSWWRC